MGAVVMTHYNRKTYRVDDIDWDNSPMSTFDMKGAAGSAGVGGTVTFVDYFAQKYGLVCTDMRQPMLVSRPKKRDYHRGQIGSVLLIPEFCQMTGLTDEMRSNFQLMKSLTGYLHVSPERRVDAVRKFMARLKRAPGVRDFSFFAQKLNFFHVIFLILNFFLGGRRTESVGAEVRQ